MKSSDGHPGRKGQDTAFIIHPVVAAEKKTEKRDIESLVAEAEGLAHAIDLKILATRTANVSKMHPGYFLGEGNRNSLGVEIGELKPEVVIFNHSLSPVQQRNLEKEWQVKVIDRTGLILLIFSARAQTKEGRLQVELAALEYQKSRLVKLWSHLERQRGGTGGMGGPGETQKELDRRMIREKIIRLKKELEDVRRTRDLGRKSRERIPLPVAALVGYTNAGKSTLFNRMTNADVFVKDLLFATLDPTMRKIEVVKGQEAILSDTVGFISDLPTHLVAAFRATLEQITHADVILHVRDIAQGDSAAQKSDVIQILADLGIEYETDERIVEIWNKIDILPKAERQELLRQSKFNGAIPLSAVTGEGVDTLKKRISEIISSERQEVKYSIAITDGKALSWLYAHAQVLKRRDNQKTISLQVMIEPRDLEKFAEHYGYKADILS